MIPVHDPVFLADPDETDALARALAPRLGAGDVLLLDGQIGAGKSQFARALIRFFLPGQEVPSPTFTLVQTYEAPDFDIWHADLYRLSHPDEALELGLVDAFDEALCLVEWPDRLGPDRPRMALTLRFSVPDEGRVVEFLSDRASWRQRLDDV